MFKKLCAAFALGLGISGAHAQEINFGIISTEATQNLKADWQPLLDDMAKQTGFKIRAFFARITPASSKACASTRCRWPGWATSRPWKPWTAPMVKCSRRW